MSENILFVSGGEYGDIYGTSLAASLKEIVPAISVRRIRGGDTVAGNRIRETDFLTEVLDREKVDCIILADQTVFDLRFIRKTKNKGIPVIYYGGVHDRPLKRGQVRKLKGLIDKVLAIFPFEVPLFEEGGVAVEFVGHPLVDIVDRTISQDEAKAALGYDRSEKPVALIAGTDGDEARNLLRLMVEGAAEAAEISTRKVKLVIPDGERYEESFLNDMVKISPRRVAVFKGQRDIALRASHVAVVVAGPVTVEAALSDTYMVILQKVSALSSLLSNLRGESRFYGLPNIIMNTLLFPELVGKDITLKKITEEVGGLVEGGFGLTMEEIDQGLAQVRERLGAPGTIREAAEAICRLMGCEPAAV
jgi:lipid-A-disaccharide synthase